MRMRNTTTCIWLVSLSLVAACGSSPTYQPPSSDLSVEYINKTDFKKRGGHAQAMAWRGRVTERCRNLESSLQRAAAAHQVDVGLIAGIVRVESSFNPDAVNRRSGATGLMQVMPSVGERLRCGDITEVETNIKCGLTILKRFMKRYDNSLIYGLSAYNAGYRIPNRARKTGTLPSNFKYVEKVLSARTSYLRHGCGE